MLFQCELSLCDITMFGSLRISICHLMHDLLNLLSSVTQSKGNLHDNYLEFKFNKFHIILAFFASFFIEYFPNSSINQNVALFLAHRLI